MKPLILALTLFAPVAAQADEWDIYSNARFGFAADVPADLSRSESDNGDGATFSDQNGALTISIYGANIVEGSFADQAALSRSAMEEQEAKVSYERISDDWFVVSGSADGGIYYHYAQALCGGQQSANLWFDYADSENAKVAPLIEHMIEAIAVADPATTCP